MVILTTTYIAIVATLEFTVAATVKASRLSLEKYGGSPTKKPRPSLTEAARDHRDARRNVPVFLYGVLTSDLGRFSLIPRLGGLKRPV